MGTKIAQLKNPTWRAAGVQIFGDVRIGDGVTFWPNAVVRAESDYVSIGDYTNVQDFAMIHIGVGPTNIGNYCSITHHATIHGASIGHNCLIGINATVMDGAVIGDNSIVAGHAIVSEGAEIPANSIVAGVPGKVIASRNNYVANKLNAVGYYRNGLAYAEGEHRLWADPEYVAEMQALQTKLEQEL